MLFLHRVRGMVVRVQAGTVLYKESLKNECSGRDASGSTGMHQWNKGPRLKGTTTPEEGEDIQ
jgi:hypothetical protein